MTDVAPLAVREYVTVEGKIPFREWLDGLDVATRARIQASQAVTIRAAQGFWKAYEEATRHGKTK